MPKPTQQTRLRSPEQDQLGFWETTTGQRSPYHPVCRFFARQRWDFANTIVPLQQLASVFDLGCGRGIASVYFEQSDKRLVGIDFAHNQLKGNPIAGMERLVALGDTVPFAANTFDLVTCWEVLHHVDTPSAVIAEMARLSREWIVIFEPNILNPAQLLFSLLVPAERNSLRLSRAIIEQSLEHSGFQVVHFRRGGWIFPNRCPRWLFRLLRLLPFPLPIVGISRLWIARRVELGTHA